MELNKLSKNELKALVQEYKDKIKEAKKEIKNQSGERKFIMILDSEHKRYLEWCAKHKGVYKAQIVRNAVLDTIKKDKEYQKQTTTHR